MRKILGVFAPVRTRSFFISVIQLDCVSGEDVVGWEEALRAVAGYG